MADTSSSRFINLLLYCLKQTGCCFVELSSSLNCVFLCFQAATKESNAEERLTPMVLAQQAAQLKQQLVSAHLDSLLGPQAHINLADPDGALARWADKGAEARVNKARGKATGMLSYNPRGDCLKKSWEVVIDCWREGREN